MARKRKGCCLGRLLSLVLVCALVLCAYMSVESRIVRLETTDVYLDDLPPAFEGTSVLFISDPCLGAYARGAKSAEVISSLQSLYPDLLLLGGKYTGRSLTPIHEGDNASSEIDAFFENLGWFYAPLGKFAVADLSDEPADMLSASMSLGGFTLLQNQVAKLEKNGSCIYLAGLSNCPASASPVDAMALVRDKDAVLGLSHGNIPFVSGEKDCPVDLMLNGAENARPIRFVLPAPFAALLGDSEINSWSSHNGCLTLTSNGLGCSLLPFRLNAPPQIHYLILHCA